MACWRVLRKYVSNNVRRKRIVQLYGVALHFNSVLQSSVTVCDRTEHRTGQALYSPLFFLLPLPSVHHASLSRLLVGKGTRACEAANQPLNMIYFIEIHQQQLLQLWRRVAPLLPAVWPQILNSLLGEGVEKPKKEAPLVNHCTIVYLLFIFQLLDFRKMWEPFWAYFEVESS